jgi:hypothetical protein
MRRRSDHSPLALASPVLLLFAAACATRGYPAHGGGKRFFTEQALVTRSIDDAISQIDFTRVRSDVGDVSDIAVQIFSVAHSGGGATSDPSSFFPFLNQLGPGAAAMPVLPVGGTSSGYFAFGFESADDIRYLMGRLIGKLAEVGLRVVTPRAEAAPGPVLCVLVGELGIDLSGFNAVVYREKELRARTSLELFVVAGGVGGTAGTTTKIGRGAATYRFEEDYFLFFGPLVTAVPMREEESQ